MKNKRKEIYQLAENIKKDWPKPLVGALEKFWLETLRDDHKGLISTLVLSILPPHPSTKQKNAAIYLGAASLYRWTAANLQDDLLDDRTTKTINLPLVKACWESAVALSLAVPLEPTGKNFLLKLSLRENNALFSEVKQPKTIPRGILAPSGKSLFLLIAPLHLSLFLGWEKTETQGLFRAGRYLLAAKQLADDLYDYRDDWQNGRRNFAHRGLKRLPEKKELPSYYRRQAEAILQLCGQCRKITKTISPLSKKNCFEPLLKPLEINCRRGLAKINQLESVNHRHPKK
ncbi:MAG TPA: hypothetical protein P5325_01675 [Candidatus Woesebacteria bacterium]|nr:hypothetical protein [bacterium]HRR05495.1 hypothetical protein [Candidatus Woesebacteria bacterium]